MPTVENKGHRFDVRPDRVDFRDRFYQPPLVSLTPEYPDPQLVDDYLAK